MCDVEHAVGPLYGAERPADDPHPEYARRITFLIDPEGVIRKVYVVTDIAGHPGELVDDLTALMNAAGGRAGH